MSGIKLIETINVKSKTVKRRATKITYSINTCLTIKYGDVHSSKSRLKQSYVVVALLRTKNYISRVQADLKVTFYLNF